ncbi:MAG: hypothetical protein CL678_17510 [Bdellovibrionaceae bacterium]|nr:hypothetical protein [Pseudobdellovibrionaceae bacterium]|tara:strand:+ start:3368 stop:3955 length:588 start_codon:yes stop_codon:yes gene_type:complete
MAVQPLTPAERNQLQTRIQMRTGFQQMMVATGGYQLHSDHNKNFDMEDIMKVVEVALKADPQNQTTPYRHFNNNPLPPFKTALSPPNLLRVYSFFELLCNLHTQGFQCMYGGNLCNYRLHSVQEFKANLYQIKIRLDVYHLVTNALVCSKTAKVTFRQHPQLKFNNGIVANPISINLYPDQANSKYCYFRVQTIT